MMMFSLVGLSILLVATSLQACKGHTFLLLLLFVGNLVMSSMKGVGRELANWRGDGEMAYQGKRIDQLLGRWGDG